MLGGTCREPTYAPKRSAKDRAQQKQAAEEAGVSGGPMSPIPPELKQLGRFAEPALARVREVSSDQSIKQEADMLTWQIRQEIGQKEAEARTSAKLR